MDPSSTVVLHLPNCMPFPLLLLGAIAAKCTVSLLSVALQPPELAYVLARLRPRVLITTKGPSAGEGRMRQALQLLIEGKEGFTGISSEATRAWAREAARDWDEGARAATLQRGESLPLRRQRVWLVDPHADYYGSGMTAAASLLRASRAALPASSVDLRDWTTLLTLPPPSSKPFAIEQMGADELRARIAIVLWSSGTTGKSKGVLISHAASIASIPSTWGGCAYLGPHRTGTNTTGQCKIAASGGTGERWISIAPWFHTYGLFQTMLPAFAIGATLHLLPPPPPPPAPFPLEQYLATLSRYRATFAQIAPPIAIALKANPSLLQKHDLTSVQGFLTGGAPVPPSAVEAVYDATDGQNYMFMGYGASETGPISHSRGPLAAAIAAGGAEGKRGKIKLRDLAELGSLGHPMPNVRVRIAPPKGASAAEMRARRDEFQRDLAIRAAAGEPVPRGCGPIGEIQVASPALFSGYYSGQGVRDRAPGDAAAGDPIDRALTADAFSADGYYATGDEGCFDAEGNLVMTGRLKELIKTKGGFQCAPPEVEACLSQHEHVQDIACVGFNEGDAGEVPWVLIVPADAKVAAAGSGQEGEEQRQALAYALNRYAAERLSHYKVPTYYSFVPVIPKNPTGKIVRKDIAQLPITKYRGREKGSARARL